MANGHDKNRIRLRLTLEGFRSRFGHWPAQVRIPPVVLADIRDSILTSESFDRVAAAITIIGDHDDIFLAEDADGNRFHYGQFDLLDRPVDMRAEEWLGPLEFREIWDELSTVTIVPAPKQVPPSKVIRRALRSHIKKAWRDVIQKDYRSQRINSEDGLEVAFCLRLTERFAKLKRRLFVHPGIRFKGENSKGTIDESFFPDLAICNSREVIAFLEFKYRPCNPSPGFKKDLKKLERIHSRKKEIVFVQLSLSRQGNRQQGISFGRRNVVRVAWRASAR